MKEWLMTNMLYNNFGTITPYPTLTNNQFNGVGIINSILNGLSTIPNIVTNSTSPAALSNGQTSSQTSLVNGFLQSSNFKTGSTGWQINANGDVEFGSGKFRGNITGATGTFSGTLSAATITGSTITGGSITGTTITGSTLTTASTGQRVELTTNFATFYNSSNVESGNIFGDASSGGLAIWAASSGNVFIRSGTSSGGIILSKNGTGNIAYIDANGVWPATDNTYNSGQSVYQWASVYAIKHYAGSVFWSSGSGTPEGAITAPVGSLFSRTDGGAGTTLYVKQSGSGNTGWVGK